MQFFSCWTAVPINPSQYSEWCRMIADVVNNHQEIQPFIFPTLNPAKSILFQSLKNLSAADPACFQNAKTNILTNMYTSNIFAVKMNARAQRGICRREAAVKGEELLTILILLSFPQQMLELD